MPAQPVTTNHENSGDGRHITKQKENKIVAEKQDRKFYIHKV